MGIKRYLYPFSLTHRSQLLLGISQIFFASMVFAGPMSQSQNPGDDALLPEPLQKFLAQAEQLERKKDYDNAIGIYQKIQKDYPTVEIMGPIGKTYGEYANERVKILKCFKRRGPDFSSARPERLAANIKEALMKRDPKRLMQLASCDFLTGAMASDDIWPLLPEEIVSVIVQNWQEFRELHTHTEPRYGANADRWSLIFSDSDNEYKEEAWRHEFDLEKQGSRWVWTGFYTAQGPLQGALYKTINKSRD